MKKKRLFIMAGGTGGHVLPCIALATELAKSREVSLGYNYLKRNLHEFEDFISSVQI